MSIPTIDISAIDQTGTPEKKKLIADARQACETYGFFIISGHSVPQELLDDVLAQCEAFFSLPADVKDTYDKSIGGFNRGYEGLRAQNFEKKTAGDLKEGFYLGIDLPLDHPKVVGKAFNMGPNKYPTHVSEPQRFRQVVDTYIAALRELAEKIVRLLCETLGVEQDWVPGFVSDPIATLRLLHYPPQPPDASEDERGIGAHTDFGAITILLQDMVGGLQVWDRTTSTWIDAVPEKGTFVVNLGNLMMRWTDDRYISNLHRVINKSGLERYSVPFFFSGNPDFKVTSFSEYTSANGQVPRAKYPPVTVGEWIAGRYADTYGTSDAKAVKELSVSDVTAATG